MNTYTFSVSTTLPTVEHTYSTIDLFDQTNFIIDLSDVYCDVFPNYIAFNWGDGSSVEEPELSIYKNYRTDSIYSEILKGPSPLFLNKNYSHIYYPSNIALNKSVTLRINIEYVTGAVTKLTVPVNIRTAGYHESVEDMEVVGLDLLDNDVNSSRYTLLTKKDNYLLQVDNTAQKNAQYPDKISWDPKFWDKGLLPGGKHWEFPGKLPFGLKFKIRLPWQGWNPGPGNDPFLLPPEIKTPPSPKIYDPGGAPGGWGLPGPGGIGIRLQPVPEEDVRLGGKNCEEKIVFPRAWKKKLRRNGPNNRRGEVNLRPRGKWPGIVPGPPTGDWETATEAEKLMTFPPFYLYLWILWRKREINYFQLQQWERCVYGPQGINASEHLFEEGLQPSAKTPDD